MDGKKAQVTVFIIIAIILLIGAVTYGIFRYTQYQQAQVDQQQIDLFNSNSQKIREYIRNCITTNAYEGLKKMGMQGGYLEIPPEIRYYDSVVWQKDGVNYQPSLEDINEQLSRYVNDKVKLCVNYNDTLKMGYNIKTGKVNASTTFTSEGVIVKVDYPVTVEYGSMVMEFNDFSTTFDVSIRKMWELGTKIDNNALEPNFNMSKPLENINQNDFELTYQKTGDNRLIYTIIDKKHYVMGKNDFTLKFAYQRGESDLIKEMKLQDNCMTSPASFTRSMYSIDRQARLLIMPGTTLSMPDDSCLFTVQQYPPFNITVYNVSIYKTFNTSIIPKYEDEVWVLNRPVYEFGPTGTESSKPMQLEIYWNEEDIERKGPIGILSDHGGTWHPIDSNPDYKKNYVWTKIDGFSNYTAIDCGLQNLKLRASFMPWSNLIPAWSDLIDLIDPTGGMISGLIGGYQVPLPITLALPDLPEIGLSCVDFTPTCDTVLVIVRLDVGTREKKIDSDPYIGGQGLDEDIKESVIGEQTEYANGECRIIPEVGDVLTDITSIDLTKLGEIFEGDTLSTILSYIGWIGYDLKKELGLDFLQFDSDMAGVNLGITYLQGGHKYQLCTIPAECSDVLCVTACGAIYP